MPQPAGPDYDQRLKVLLKEFFETFCLYFFPAWAERFDFGQLTWLDKEVLMAPPQAEKCQLDLKQRPGGSCHFLRPPDTMRERRTP
jgi:hypothetical protein